MVSWFVILGFGIGAVNLETHAPYPSQPNVTKRYLFRPRSIQLGAVPIEVATNPITPNTIIIINTSIILVFLVNVEYKDTKAFGNSKHFLTFLLVGV